MTHKKFIAATSHMYEVLFGEDQNDIRLAKSGPEAKHLPNNMALSDPSMPVADTVPVPERIIRFSS
jgi:hypothetical protein